MTQRGRLKMEKVTKNKYFTPETKVVDLQTEGVICALSDYWSEPLD